MDPASIEYVLQGVSCMNTTENGRTARRGGCRDERTPTTGDHRKRGSADGRTLNGGRTDGPSTVTGIAFGVHT